MPHSLARKLHVHDGLDDFDDVSVAHVRLSETSTESVAATEKSRSSFGCLGSFLVSGDVCEPLPSMPYGWMIGLIFHRIRKAVALKKEFAYLVF